MTRRSLSTALVLALGLGLAGCESLDFDKFNIFGDTKKPLPGERKALFPEGVPGVPQGIPPELVKGNQQAIDQQTPPQAAPPAAPPKQAVVTQPAKPKPKKQATPTSVTVAPTAAKPAAPATPARTTVSTPSGWQAPPDTAPAPWPGEAPAATPQPAR